MSERQEQRHRTNIERIAKQEKMASARAQRDERRERTKQRRLDEEARLLAETSAGYAAETALHASQQTALLAAMRTLSEDLASERRRSAAREDIQQRFNKRMSWAAVLLAGAAVVVPFAILLIEQTAR
ncbi:hypothetical protein ACIPUB_09945 [Paeniglutamicibacter sp. ORCA_105]|uniref:hypothetical protein n=1 Tax=Paeniglutamicibacter sp. ORCA_105 TaxID=3377336 RepID=UPI003894CA0E